eukprot:scaffold6474_cov23-Cyclotella_meneghiniana.AAC.6
MLLGTPLASNVPPSVYEWIESFRLQAESFTASIASMRSEMKSFDSATVASRQQLLGQMTQVMHTANSAGATATRALELASMSGATGVTGRLNSMEQAMTALRAAQASQSTDLDGLFGAVTSLTAARSAATVSEVTTSATAEEFGAFKQDIIDKITAIKQSVSEGGPITVGGFTFDGIPSCSAWLVKQNITETVYQNFLDVVSGITCVDGSTKRAEDFHSEAILQLKTEKSTQSMKVALSFEAPVPAILAGTNRPTDPQLTHRSHFGAITSHKFWDAGDSRSGMVNWIKQGWHVLERSTTQQVDTLYSQSNPDFARFVTAMMRETGNQLLELCDEVSNLHSNLLHLSYGQKNWSDAEKKETWAYVLVFLDVYFQAHFKKRSLAKNLHGYTSPLVANSVAMWATIQSIEVHRQFKKASFREHPDVYPKMQTHLTQNCVRKNEFQGVAATVAAAQEDVEVLQQEQSRILDLLIRLEAKMGRLAQQCGSPGAVAIGDKRKKRAAKKALERAADS